MTNRGLGLARPQQWHQRLQHAGSQEIQAVAFRCKGDHTHGMGCRQA